MRVEFRRKRDTRVASSSASVARIRAAAVASSAMAAFEKQKPDLAILDINLAGGTAYSLAEKMMEEDVPVIFHSGQVTSAEVQALYPGASALSKPCPPNVILDTVQQALDSAEL